MEQPSRHGVKVFLSQILLLGTVDIDEENNPLTVTDPFLSNDDCIMKRAIQAYYLIHDIDSQDSKRITERLHNILSGNIKVTLDSNSEKDWLPEASHYYAEYVKYKDKEKEPTKNDTDVDQTENKSMIASNSPKNESYTNYSCGQLFQPYKQYGNDKEDDNFGNRPSLPTPPATQQSGP